MLRQVVVDDQRVFPPVAEVFADRATRIRRDELHWRRVGRARGYDHRVVHRTALFENGHDVRDRRHFLPDRDVDAFDVAVALVDDRVDRDRGLADLTVADDELALTATDRHHRIDTLEPDLHRLFHALARDHT